MSINNFTKVAITDGKLVANAETLSGPGGQHMNAGPGVVAFVQATLVRDDTKHCLLVPHHAETSPWFASSDPPYPLKDNDEIDLVGCIIPLGGEPFLWFNRLTIGADPETKTP
jgi:hypothetical protein